MSIDGHWHAAGRAARLPATLDAMATGTPRPGDEAFALRVISSDAQVLVDGAVPVSISDRLGRLERRVTFEDGSVFVTADNAAVDRLLVTSGRLPSRVHGLESRAPLILVALIVTVAFAFGLFRYGIPFASERIAQALPQRAGEIVSRSTLDFLDDWVLEPSALGAGTAAAIEARLHDRLLPLDARNDGIRYRIHVRAWTVGGTPVPNALALPSGDIVLSDAFIELCETDDEMDAVILHEIGHIVERHSLQRIVQASFIGTLTMLVTGDGSALADMGVGLGTLLVGSHYSRTHESDADRYAFERMLQAGIDPVAFGDIMTRMAASVTRDGTPSDRSQGPVREGVLDYLGSHPSSAARVALAQRYGECFRRGQAACDID